MLLGGKGGGGDFDSDSDSGRSRAPARSAGRAASNESSFDDFPTALEDQDDELPC
jgi:hypothetical protein